VGGGFPQGKHGCDRYGEPSLLGEASGDAQPSDRLGIRAGAARARQAHAVRRSVQVGDGHHPVPAPNQVHQMAVAPRAAAGLLYLAPVEFCFVTAPIVEDQTSVGTESDTTTVGSLTRRGRTVRLAKLAHRAGTM
jgi:hypothetical protein